MRDKTAITTTKHTENKNIKYAKTARNKREFLCFHSRRRCRRCRRRRRRYDDNFFLVRQGLADCTSVCVSVFVCDASNMAEARTCNSCCSSALWCCHCLRLCRRCSRSRSRCWQAQQDLHCVCLCVCVCKCESGCFLPTTFALPLSPHFNTNGISLPCFELCSALPLCRSLSGCCCCSVLFTFDSDASSDCDCGSSASSGWESS